MADRGSGPDRGRNRGHGHGRGRGNGDASDTSSQELPIRSSGSAARGQSSQGRSVTRSSTRNTATEHQTAPTITAQDTPQPAASTTGPLSYAAMLRRGTQPVTHNASANRATPDATQQVFSGPTGAPITVSTHEHTNPTSRPPTAQLIRASPNAASTEARQQAIGGSNGLLSVASTAAATLSDATASRKVSKVSSSHDTTASTSPPYQGEDGALGAKHRLNDGVVVSRPDYGSSGQDHALQLHTNYLGLNLPSGLMLYRYDIDLGEARLTTSVKDEAIMGLIRDHIEHLTSGMEAVSDLRTILITSEPLSELGPFRVTIQNRPDVQHVDIELRNQTDLNFADLISSNRNPPATCALDRRQDLLQALNISLGWISQHKLNMVKIGRNIRLNQGRHEHQDLAGGIIARRAFVFSARAATGKILLNIQVKSLPFYHSNALTTLAMQQAWPNLSRALRGVRITVPVQVSAGPQTTQRQAQIISGFANTQNGVPPSRDRTQLSDRDITILRAQDTVMYIANISQHCTVQQYYQRRGIRIDGGLPVINIGQRNAPDYRAIEVCNIQDGQIAKVDLTEKQEKDLIGFAVRRPAENARSVRTDAITILPVTNVTTLFGLTATPGLLSVQGRFLAAPEICYTTYGAGIPVEDGSWDLRRKTFYSAKSVQKCWTVHASYSRQGEEQNQALSTRVIQFWENLANVGITGTPNKRLPILQLNKGDTLAKQGDSVRSFLDTQLKDQEKPDLILFIVPGKDNVKTYNAIKFGCEHELGLLSQCVVESKLKKLHAKFCANVGMKINLKLGGTNHVLPEAHLSITAQSAEKLDDLKRQNTMYVGLDVTHPAPDSKSTTPSIASIVSSVEATLSQWPAVLQVQGARVEMIDGLAKLFERQLHRWYDRNGGSLPKYIIVYRDGVSEGQYRTVLEVEVEAMKQAVKTVYRAKGAQQEARLTVVVVGKRHHTRFYPMRGEDGDPDTGNAKNGLVVDQGITNRMEWDFFLQAHRPLGGTARPAHYVVLYDEIFRALHHLPVGAVDALEKLTHELCYLFGRATSAVSICPPAYYADLACTRARCYLADRPETKQQIRAAIEGGRAFPIELPDSIRDKMFYI